MAQFTPGCGVPTMTPLPFSISSQSRRRDTQPISLLLIFKALQILREDFVLHVGWEGLPHHNIIPPAHSCAPPPLPRGAKFGVCSTSSTRSGFSQQPWWLDPRAELHSGPTRFRAEIRLEEAGSRTWPTRADGAVIG
ncbi:hypothetical protein RRG08_039495 [Elysia crispata]|uniref:Uncharacterized protein n=1 Tax=Elysia crispata TaxID=231223 RepID=A0AAE0YKW2_9GAST|nr:hypothetical protein RRG08_039495 [Elysia crispata]